MRQADLALHIWWRKEASLWILELAQFRYQDCLVNDWKIEEGFFRPQLYKIQEWRLWVSYQKTFASGSVGKWHVKNKANCPKSVEKRREWRRRKKTRFAEKNSDCWSFGFGNLSWWRSSLDCSKATEVRRNGTVSPQILWIWRNILE